jgi:hypothetical protein
MSLFRRNLAENFVPCMQLHFSPKSCPLCLGAGDQPFSGDCWLPGASKFLDRTFCGKCDYAIYYTTAASAFPRMRILPRNVSDNNPPPPLYRTFPIRFGQLHGKNIGIPALLHSCLYNVHAFLDPTGLGRRLFVIWENPRKYTVVYFW